MFINDKILSTYINQCFESIDFSGNIVIQKGDNVIFEKSIGFVDYHNKCLMNHNTVFELASVSKTFTSYLISLAIKKKLLYLNDSISKYIPINYKYSNITINQLANHTSGLIEYKPFFKDGWDKNSIAQNIDLLNLLDSECPDLLFPSGTDWHYADTNYALLCNILENVFEMPFEKILQNKIFSKFNLANTFLKKEFYFSANEAIGHTYSIRNNDFVNHIEFDECANIKYLKGIVGGTGINSNINDLIMWSSILKENFDPYFLKHHFPLYPHSKYELGWNLEFNPVVGRVIFHLGSWFGYKLFIRRYLDIDCTVIVLRNNGFFLMSNLMLGIEDIITGKTTTQPNFSIAYEVAKKFDKFDSTRLKSYFLMQLKKQHSKFIDKRDFRELEFVVRNTSNRSLHEQKLLLLPFKKYKNNNYVL